MEDRILSVEEYEKELADEKKAAAEEAGLQQRPRPQQTVAPEREAILDAARECVCRNREADYGSPEDSFGMIARLWSAYTGYEFNPADVAALIDAAIELVACGELNTLSMEIDGCGAAKITATKTGGVRIIRSRKMQKSEETV